MSLTYACCNENRKAAVLGNPTLNGIDYLEVLDHDAIPLGIPRQQTLVVHCLNALAGNLAVANVLIGGGESITDIGVAWVALASNASTLPASATAAETAYYAGLADAAKVLIVRTKVAGDFSPYTLRLVAGAQQAAEDPFDLTEALAGFDPELSEVEFSFKVECPPYFDCAPATPDCAPDLPDPPPINYLAKDYGAFRTILLDRLNQLLPDWGAASEADMGVVMAELVAYVGDYLSYQQDAVATEAYIETARSRISLRRHALLVDYAVHDGCNARTWMHLEVNASAFLDRTLTRFYTFGPGMPSSLAVGAGNEEAALNAGVIVFEPMQDAVLYPEHNQMSFYTWGDTDCCLPARATEATLLGSYPNLQPGDVLIFEEVLGPRTGDPADADIRHRCAVRLTQVATQNSLGQPLLDPLFTTPGADGVGDPVTSAAQSPAAVTEIQWSSEDALPFPVCLSSSFIDSTGKLQSLTDVSIVLGNIVLADQGLHLSAVSLGTVPQPSIFPPDNSSRCNPTQPQGLPVRYRPVLPDAPISQAVPLPLAGAPMTTSIVSLLTSGFANLVDANGYTSLSIQAADPWSWPQYFGVSVIANALHPANFDLSVVYDPTGGPHGVTGPVVLELFPDLSLTNTDPNYAPTQINAFSRFFQVPAGFTPFGTAPTAYPANPTPLPNSGPVNLVDSGGSAYLTVQASNPLSWPPAFGVIAESSLLHPDQFNLLVVYNPPSAEGVQVPVLAERYNGLTLDNAASTVALDSELIRVRSYSEQPNPGLSASALMNYDADEALPAVTLSSFFDNRTTSWTPLANLLQAGPADANFVAEIEYDGIAHLRFGDDTNGLTPESGAAVTATYRVGNGTAGNVGAESLVFLATGDARIVGCTNPLPASGGVDPETTEQIRRHAPEAFLTQERAITMPDYVAIAERNSQIDEAVATLRWTGSWYTVFLAAEPTGAGNLTPVLRRSLTRFVNRYRLAGQDLRLESPHYVPLNIKLTVCVDPGYFQANVRKGLLQALSCAGLFAPDIFRFGQTVYLSPIYAAARKVAGVTSVAATVFGPQGVNDPSYLANGEIPLGPLQIARMDNDPSYPNHGQLTLVLQGGK
ncbi:MAG: putative baseplate assembly protein [Terracidiphilus sp.]